MENINTSDLRSHMNEWFRWNDKANNVLIDAVKDSGVVLTRCREILCNVLADHENWLNRICTVDIDPVDDLQSVTDILGRNALIHSLTHEFLKTDSYGNNFDWKFLCAENGKPKTYSLKEVYFHILTYSAFHRGEVTKLLQGAGVTVPKTDYLSLMKHDEIE